jgi:hypothetical protein
VSQQRQPLIAVLGFFQFGERFLKLSNNCCYFIFGHADQGLKHEAGNGGNTEETLRRNPYGIPCMFWLRRPSNGVSPMVKNGIFTRLGQ